ncbi:MAG: hypothetical protein ACLT2F_03045 [Butyricicoccus sp.]
MPHAKINAVDYSAAEQAEGVVRIVTAADVPGMNKVGTWTPEQPVFARMRCGFSVTIWRWLSRIRRRTRERPSSWSNRL